MSAEKIGNDIAVDLVNNRFRSRLRVSRNGALPLR